MVVASRRGFEMVFSLLSVKSSLLLCAAHLARSSSSILLRIASFQEKMFMMIRTANEANAEKRKKAKPTFASVSTKVFDIVVGGLGHLLDSNTLTYGDDEALFKSTLAESTSVADDTVPTGTEHDIIIMDPYHKAGPTLISLGLAVFVLTWTASYTASLASILTIEHAQTSTNDIEDAIAQNLRICANRKQGLIHIEERFPTANFVHDPEDGLKGILSRTNTIEYIDQNVCDVAVVSMEDLDVFHMQGKHCNKHAVGEIVGVSPKGMPLASRWDYQEKVMAYHFLKELTNPTGWPAIKRRTKDALSTSHCDSKTNALADADGLDISQMSGIFMVTLAFFIAGVVSSMCTGSVFAKKVLERRQKRKYQQEHGNQSAKFAPVTKDNGDDDIQIENPVLAE